MTMKKRIVSILLCAVFLLFAGCAAPISTPEPTMEPTAEPTAEPTPEMQEVTLTLRVIAAYENGSLLLADPESTGVYRNTLPGGTVYPAGTLLNVTCTDSVLESYPAQFEKILSAEPIEDGFDDRCALYLKAMEDLWEMDPALQADIHYIGVDLSKTALTKSEQAAVAWRFGELKQTEVLNATFEELCEQGYIDRENLVWEDGCHFAVEDNTPPEGSLVSAEITFTAQKWRSGLGAVFITECRAERDGDGSWSDYTADGFAIA